MPWCSSLHICPTKVIEHQQPWKRAENNLKKLHSQPVIFTVSAITVTMGYFKLTPCVTASRYKMINQKRKAALIRYAGEDWCITSSSRNKQWENVQFAIPTGLRSSVVFLWHDIAIWKTAKRSDDELSKDKIKPYPQDWATEEAMLALIGSEIPSFMKDATVFWRSKDQ